MTTPLSSFAGIASGFKYSDLVDAIIKQESQPLTRLQDEKSAIASRQQALGTYRSLLDDLRTAARALRDGSAFSSTSVTAAQITGSVSVVSAASTADATPASWVIGVQQLAHAEKLGSTPVANVTTALNVVGSFTVNGQAVDVAASDSLEAVRDRINALNAGATPSGVTATILNVGTNDARLVLSANKTGATGVVLTETTNTPLQALGFLEANGSKKASAILSQGRDAHLTVDGVNLVRTSNVVTDAIAGVTLTLTGEDATSSISLTTARYGESASAAMQKFADAYNKLGAFLKQQQTVTNGNVPALHGDATIRNARGTLPTMLLQTIGGAGALQRAADAGLSLQMDGTLKFDATTFGAAFNGHFGELRDVFAETLSATDSQVTLVSGGGQVASAEHAVVITSPASHGTIATNSFPGVYDDGGTPDTVTVIDNSSGRSVQVTLVSGMTTADIVAAIAAAVEGANLPVSASAEGNDIRLTHQNAGSHAGLSITVSGTGDGSAEAWSAGATSSGTDVAGTIGGLAATGSGEMLVGNSGTAVAGIAVRYAGTTARAAGTVSLQLGAGALVERTLDTFLNVGTGSLDMKMSQWSDRNTTIDDRINTMQARLDRRRASLTAQFVRMEQAVSRLQGQMTSLSKLSSGSTS